MNQGILKVVFTSEKTIKYIAFKYNLTNWIILKPSFQIKFIKGEIYKKGTFKFFTDYTIKTSEMTISLEQDDQVIRLLDNRSVEKHKKDGYNFIHFGMIQIGRAHV